MDRFSYLRRQKEIMFSVRSVCLSVCLSVCPSDYSETCERILTKFFGEVGHGSRTKWYNFGGDPDHASDPGVQSPKSGSSGSAEVCSLWVHSCFSFSYRYWKITATAAVRHTPFSVTRWRAVHETWLELSQRNIYRQNAKVRGDIPLMHRIGTLSQPPPRVHVNTLSHLRLYRATVVRDKIAGGNCVVANWRVANCK